MTERRWSNVLVERRSSGRSSFPSAITGICRKIKSLRIGERVERERDTKRWLGFVELQRFREKQTVCVCIFFLRDVNTAIIFLFYNTKKNELHFFSNNLLVSSLICQRPNANNSTLSSALTLKFAFYFFKCPRVTLFILFI